MSSLSRCCECIVNRRRWCWQWNAATGEVLKKETRFATCSQWMRWNRRKVLVVVMVSNSNRFNVEFKCSEYFMSTQLLSMSFFSISLVETLHSKVSFRYLFSWHPWPWRSSQNDKTHKLKINCRTISLQQFSPCWCFQFTACLEDPWFDALWYGHSRQAKNHENAWPLMFSLLVADQRDWQHQFVWSSFPWNKEKSCPSAWLTKEGTYEYME